MTPDIRPVNKRIIEMYNNYESIQYISRALQIDPKVVSHTLQEHDIDIRDTRTAVWDKNHHYILKVLRETSKTAPIGIVQLTDLINNGGDIKLGYNTIRKHCAVLEDEGIATRQSGGLVVKDES